MRYTVRKEPFGGLMYDRQADAYIPIDHNFYQALKRIHQTGDASFLPEKHKALLVREGMLDENGLACSVVDGSYVGENLSAPVRIHYCYTYECNLNCKHCFTKLQRRNSPELTFQEKLQMLDQMSALGISEILVGGGEPLVKTDFLDFVDACNQKAISVKVFTNGLLLDESFIKALSTRKIQYLSVSIDGTSEEEYQATRGVRALETVIANIRTAKKYCTFPVAISVTVNSQNWGNARGYLEIAKRANADRIKIRPTKPSGNVNVNPEIYPTPQQYLEFMKDIQRLWNREYKDLFRLDFSWGDTRIRYNPDSDALEVIHNPFPYQGYGCFAGKGSMVIRANGDVSPCGFLPETMQTRTGDNVREKTIKELWDTAPRFTALRKIAENPKCVNCRYYDVCRGGCIARILYNNRKLNDTDPWCLDEFFPAKL